MHPHAEHRRDSGVQPHQGGHTGGRHQQLIPDSSFSISSPMLRFLLIACVVAVSPLMVQANPTAEIQENDFLDLVDGDGNVLIQARGVDAVNAEARAQGLAFPALGYWSPEGHCFVRPAPGDCNGVFKR